MLFKINMIKYLAWPRFVWTGNVVDWHKIFCLVIVRTGNVVARHRFFFWLMLDRLKTRYSLRCRGMNVAANCIFQLARGGN